MPDMRVLFMGTPEFACPTLKSLVASGYNVIGVFTQADRPKGRGQILQPPPVKRDAERLGLTVYQPSTLTQKEIGDLWSALRPDTAVVVAYGHILPSWLLRSVTLGCINLHASLLPLYRGAAPINWAVINGERRTGVTTMLMDEGMDTGPILMQSATEIGPDDCAGSLYDRLSLIGAGLMMETLKGIAEGNTTPRAQPEGGATLAPKLEREIGRIDWGKENISIWNLIRGINPFPGAFTFLEGRMIKVWDAMPLDGEAAGAQPGEICGVDLHGGLLVQTGKGRLSLREIQPESKKRMNAHAYAAGLRFDIQGKSLKPFLE